MGEQVGVNIPLNGGLNLVDPHHVLQQELGQAKKLVNFVPEVYAGYKRVDGYEKFGTAQPSGSADTVHGVFPYADGIIAVSGDGVYFSTDGVTWLQVNRDTYTAQTGTVAVNNGSGNYIDVAGTSTSFTTEFAVGDNVRISGNIRQVASITDNVTMTLESEIAGGVAAGASIYLNGDTGLAGSAIARTAQGQTQFAFYENDGDYGSVAFTDTNLNNGIGWFKITGDGGSRAYHYDVLTPAGFASPEGAKYCCTFKERLVVAHGTDSPGTVTYSERYSNKRFDGAGSGSVDVDGHVTGIYPWKDKLLIFTNAGIYQLVNIEDASNIAVLPITTRVGCPNGFTIQEVGGDIIFLASDSIRTISASEQYGDISLSAASRKIDPLVNVVLGKLATHTLSSVYIREKNQYRIFYTDPAQAANLQLGIAGTLKRGAQGQIEWQWAELLGFNVASITSKLDEDGTESIYHGAYNGYVYEHDMGTDFDGDNITARIDLHEIDYGSQGQRKTLHYVILTGRADGDGDDCNITVQFDRNDQTTMQPPTTVMSGFEGLAFYGTGVFGTAKFSTGRADYNRRVLLQGSGYSNSFQFDTYGTGNAFSIDGLYIDLRVGSMW